MSVNYVQGDLFEMLPQTSEPKYIPHVVNNIGKMGSGFAKAVITRYPVVKKEYLEWFEAGDNKDRPFILGGTQYVIVQSKPTIVVCNMIAQSGLIGPNNPKPIRYSALVSCMMAFSEHVKRVCSVATIHAPMFGSKRAGGNWEFIKELIEECWRDIPVTIYCFEDD